MASFMVQVSYTSEALSALIAKPQDRAGHIGKVIAGLGGKLVGSWLAFGDHDLVMIVEMPNNVSAAALSLAAAAPPATAPRHAPGAGRTRSSAC